MKESQLENKTSIATNDYVRMVDENGNSVKIKKDSFMAAIRDALPSIISDGATDGGSVLSIIGGALKSRTDANLASVLGVAGSHYISENVDNIQGNYYGSTTQGTQYGLPTNWGSFLSFNTYGGYACTQFWVMSTMEKVYVRMFLAGGDAARWTSWKYITLA